MDVQRADAIRREVDDHFKAILKLMMEYIDMLRATEFRRSLATTLYTICLVVQLCRFQILEPKYPEFIQGLEEYRQRAADELDKLIHNQL